jgi:glycosyltransferase involved in cell wall biosynthesis/SAM-dependent methyltransferase
MRACTIVARNYLAQAEVLAHSFKQHHPDCPFTILIIDELSEQQTRGDDVELLSLADINLEPGDEFRMPILYDVTELSTAVKPWLLRRLLDESTQSVVYFDPDIEIFAPLYDLGELARKHSIILTPHVTEPIPQDALRLNESDILGSGIYNLGFIAIGPRSEPFLEWWAARLRRESLIDPARMRFTDQRWIDFVPGLYSHYIVRDPGYNVAYWNLHSRELKWERNHYTVNGRPLRFFHYSGYSPDQPHLLSKHQGDRPRVLLSEHPGVARICKEYRKKLIEAGFSETKRNPYHFDELSNGLKLDHRIRTLYRDALEKHEKDHSASEPPSPFAPDGEAAFLAWLNESLRATPPDITRFMIAIHSARGDLQQAFPQPLGNDAEKFHNWFFEWGTREEKVHESLIPATAALASSRPVDTGAASTITDEPRVTVAGYFRAELGVGEAARLLTTGLAATATPYITKSFDETLNRQHHPFEDTAAAGAISDINIICVNADQTPIFAQRMGAEFFKGRYTIGVWFWEVEDFPSLFHGAFDYVDEVWVATEFMRSTLLKVASKPVHKFHLPIVTPTVNEGLSKADVGLPEGFTFLFSFDFLSVLRRKNPTAVINAFKRAFKPGEGPRLMIKTINGDKRVLELEKVRFAAGKRSDIIISDGYLSAIEKNTMMALCDCYVSLHRSEGFGLTMAEAMALAKPVIATAYSGNMEFMTPKNSYLCPFEYCAIGTDAAPYPPTAAWAQPDIDKAAELMRCVYLKQDEAADRGLRAAEDIRFLHSPRVAGGAIKDRISAIRARRLRFGSGPLLDVLEQRLEVLEAAPRAVLHVSEEERSSLLRLEGRAAELETLIKRANASVDELTAKEERNRAALDDLFQARHEQQAIEMRLRDIERAVSALTALSQAIDDHSAHLHILEQGRIDLQAAIEARFDPLEAAVKSLHGCVEDLRRLVDSLDRRLSDIASHIEAMPYMSDPSMLRIETSGGEETIGYRNCGGNGARGDLYVSFENIFRGPEELIKKRQRPYLEVLRKHRPVLDLGCGRGEMLDLLREKGIRAVGIDSDPGMIARAAAKGHKVVQEDAVRYLAAQRDQSIGAIFSAQVIEHLPYETLLELLRLGRSKLKPGGVLIMETVNPHSHRALRTFWVDPTHNKPIFPEVLVVLCREFGFDEAIVQFPCGTGDFERDRLLEGEYAVVAKSSSVPKILRRRNSRPVRKKMKSALRKPRGSR